MGGVDSVKDIGGGKGGKRRGGQWRSEKGICRGRAGNQRSALVSGVMGEKDKRTAAPH